MKELRTILLAAVGVWLCSTAGCGPPAQDLYARLQHEDPSVRNQAIAHAGRTKDPKAVPYLVDRLTDTQEDVRFFAVLALRRTTGKTMGYRYYDPPDKRRAAVRRWREWVAGGRTEAASTQEAKGQ